ncbi:hypothetical protein RYX36_014099 [Vicia faba]
MSKYSSLLNHDSFSNSNHYTNNPYFKCSFTSHFITTQGNFTIKIYTKPTVPNFLVFNFMSRFHVAALLYALSKIKSKIALLSKAHGERCNLSYKTKTFLKGRSLHT